MMKTCFKVAYVGAIAAAAMVMGDAARGAETSDILLAYMAPDEPPSFDTDTAAVECFRTTVESGSFDDLASLLGLDADKARDSDGVMETYEEIREGIKTRLRVENFGDRRILQISKDLWPLPFQIAKGEDGKWAFDTYGGLEEVANRRVGENELTTIETMRAYVSAQEDYAETDRDGDGVKEYAQKLISSEGAQDGLYWPSPDGEDDSPAGPSLADGAVLAKAKAGNGYYGYRYRILTRQGENVVGGSYSYIINGNMIAGYALVAWPVNHGVSGVYTFLVSKEGIVYQANLGSNTERIASNILTFNPDDSWAVSND